MDDATGVTTFTDLIDYMSGAAIANEHIKRCHKSDDEDKLPRLSKKGRLSFSTKSEKHAADTLKQSEGTLNLLATAPKPDMGFSPTSDAMQIEDVSSSSSATPPTFVALPAPLPLPRPEIKRDRAGIPLEPYIQPPYLTSPVPTEDGGFIYYSCRPGGPRLYDYLQVLSLKPYGLMRWQVEEAEAHILESDDLSDAMKCMHALHNRWVLLHEVNMRVDSAKCIADLVHTWWYHIYNMVGVRVLTLYLTEFKHLRHLTVQQAGDICHQYRINVKSGTARDGSLLSTVGPGGEVMQT